MLIETQVAALVLADGSPLGLSPEQYGLLAVIIGMLVTVILANLRGAWVSGSIARELREERDGAREDARTSAAHVERLTTVMEAQRDHLRELSDVIRLRRNERR